ncbi:unnamed protein product [Brassica oleracea var. botrytis]
MNFKLRWLVSDLGSLPIGALLICLRSLLNLLKNRAPPSVGGLLHRRDLFHLHCLVSMASSSETVKLLLYSSFDMLSPIDQLSLSSVRRIYCRSRAIFLHQWCRYSNSNVYQPPDLIP